MLAVCAAAVVSVVAVTEADAGGHIRKHHQRTSIGFNNARAARAMVPVAGPRGSVCPGNARAIDCTVWPPPIDEDPDRKSTSSDGG
jgi:hypothetical protein